MAVWCIVQDENRQPGRAGEKQGELPKVRESGKGGKWDFQDDLVKDKLDLSGSNCSGSS